MEWVKRVKLRRRTSVQRSMAVLSLFLMVSSCISLSYAADTVEVSYSVTYGQSEARGMLNAINQWRTGSTWYWNKDNQTKTAIEAGERESLVYSNYLEKAAMQRVAEIVLTYSHDRPNGEKYYTIYDEGNRYVGENIAYGYTSADSVLEAWKEEEDNYGGQGHRRNMLNENYGYIGIGHAKYKGIDFWVQELGEYDDNSELPVANDSDSKVTVEVKGMSIERLMSFSDTEISLNLNQNMILPTVEPCIRTSNTTKRFNGVMLSNIPVSWRSSNENVVQISGNSVNAVGTGTSTLTASADILGDIVEKSISVTVTGTNASLSTTIDNTTRINGSSSNQYRSNIRAEDDDDEDDDSDTEPSGIKTITLQSNNGTGKLSYDLDKTEKTATFTKVTKKSSSVTIPATIEYNNKKYKVTEIESEAFKGRSRIDNIELDAKNIQDVGYEAFKGIKRNATITISAKTKKRYNRLVNMIRDSGIKKVNFVFKKKV